MKSRVILWGTGFVGKLVAAQLIDHPAYSLAAVIVHDPRKDGVDIGTLTGGASVGLRCTTDVSAALRCDADAVAYFGPTAMYVQDNLANMTAALRAGKHVVSTAMTPLVDPASCPAFITEPLMEACRAGSVACFTTGIDPGFANDLLPLTLLGVCARVDRLCVQELLDYATYPGDLSPMGFGQPLSERCLLEEPDILIYAWGHTLHTIARAIGVTFERIDTTWEKWPAERAIEYAHGVIRPGECAAVRFQIRGWLDGAPRVILEHVNRMGQDAAPEWPRPTSVDGDAYRVMIEGAPSITQETTFRANNDANQGGCLATGMRAIHAIPALKGKVGLLCALDLPLATGLGTMVRMGTWERGQDLVAQQAER